MIKTAQFIKQLERALVEKDVENIYRQLFQMGIPDSVITSPYGGDGVLKSKAENLIALLEFKYDYDFTARKDIIKVLIQALYYLKKTEKAGDILPSIIFVGDKNECFVIHLNSLQKYLDYNLNWGIAPSLAATQNPELTLTMFKDDNIHPFVFDVAEGFDFSEVVNKILDLNSNIVRLIRITEKNISNIFEYFDSKVLAKNKKLDTNAKVGLFINILTNPNENYIHPKKKNTLITPEKEITVKGDKFASFFSHFERSYKPSEKEVLISISDRLIEDETRRREGAFFTPTIWVNEAHKMITEQFGENWKEEYVVWDPAWGTGNLTRDYKFKELYCSTLIQDELDMAEQNGINPEATKFQYDFLRDVPIDSAITISTFENKLPDGLVKALMGNKPLIVLMNPPYGTASNSGTKSDHKAGIAINPINTEMKNNKIGACSQQLYAQFMYKLVKLKKYYNLTNMSICQFSPPLFLTGGSYKKFRTYWLSQFKMTDGMVFQASNFSEVSTQWGILFSIWKSGNGLTNNFSVKIKEQAPIDKLGLNCIQITEDKKLYNLDGGYPASKWVREEIKGLKTYDTPNLSSGCKIKQSGKGKLTLKNIGSIINSGNNTYENTTGIALFSSKGLKGHNTGLSVIPENFRKVSALFTARRLLTGKYANWINDKDEYSAPDTTHPDYKQWNNDAVIYSLFNSASNQSSLRDITYKDKQWDIKNEWFWLSNNKIKKLADKHSNQAIYDDCKAFNKERYVYLQLKDLKLSGEASDVLNRATELVITSFKYREMMDEEHPEFHLNSWDAGWYQIKKILKEFLNDDLKEFNLLYKKLGDKMRPGVYEFGFLKK